MGGKPSKSNDTTQNDAVLSTAASPVVPEQETTPFAHVNMPTFDCFIQHLQQQYGNDFSGMPHTKDTAFVIVQHGFLNTGPILQALRNFGVPLKHIFLSTKPHTTPEEMERFFQQLLGPENYVPFCWPDENEAECSDYAELSIRTCKKLLAVMSEQLLNPAHDTGIKNLVVCDEGGRFLNEFIKLYRHPDEEKYSWKTFKNFHVSIIDHTNCGIRAEQLKHLASPFIAMSRSLAKLEYESPLIANAIFRALDRQLPELIAAGHTQFAVLGLGPIGQAVLSHLIQKYSDRGITITVHDRDQEKYRWLNKQAASNEQAASQGGPWARVKKERNIEEAARVSAIILGCTGNNIFEDLGITAIMGMTTETHLISCSSGQREFEAVIKNLKIKFRSVRELGTHCHQSKGKKLFLHNAGLPRNFSPEASAGLLDSEAQLTCSLKLAALVQALQIFHLWPLLRQDPEGDRWLKNFIQLSYQHEILSWYAQHLPEGTAYARHPAAVTPQDIVNFSVDHSAVMPSEDALLKRDIFNQGLRNKYRSGAYCHRVAKQNYFPTSVTANAMSPMLQKKKLAQDIGWIEEESEIVTAEDIFSGDFQISTFIEGGVWSGKTVFSHALVEAFYNEEMNPDSHTFRLVAALRPYVRNYAGVIHLNIQEMDRFNFTNVQDESYSPESYKFAHFILDQIDMTDEVKLGTTLLARIKTVLQLLAVEQSKALIKDSNTYLLVVDGLERLSLRQNDSVFREILKYTPKIITARPGALANYREYIRQGYRLGALPLAAALRFIEDFFVARNQESSSRALLNFIHHHKTFDSLLSSPMTLRMLCVSWAEYRSEIENSARINLLDIISLLVEKRIFSCEVESSTETNVFAHGSNSEQDLRQIFSELQRLAFAMLAKGYRTVTCSETAEILGFKTLRGVSVVENKLKVLQKINFFIAKDSFQQRKSYGFEHDLFQDCLAANDIVRQLCSDNSGEVTQIVNWLALNKYKRMCQSILSFVAGLVMTGSELWLWSQGNADHYKVATARSNFWQAMRLQVDIIGQYHLSLLVNFLPYIQSSIEDMPRLNITDYDKESVVRHEYDYADRALLNIMRFNFSSLFWNSLSLHSEKIDCICRTLSQGQFAEIFPLSANWLRNGPLAQDLMSSNGSKIDPRYIHRLAVARLGHLVGVEQTSLAVTQRTFDHVHYRSDEEAKLLNEAHSLPPNEQMIESEILQCWKKGAVSNIKIICMYRELYVTEENRYENDDDKRRAFISTAQFTKWFFDCQTFYPEVALERLKRVKAENSDLLIQCFISYIVAAASALVNHRNVLSRCRDRLDLFIDTVGAINILKMYQSNWVYFEEYPLPTQISRHMVFGIDPAVIVTAGNDESLTFYDHDAESSVTFTKANIGSYIEYLHEFIETKKTLSEYPFALFGHKIAKQKSSAQHESNTSSVHTNLL